MHSSLHESHDADGHQYIHCQSGRGRFLCHPLLFAADSPVGRDRDVVHGQVHVQGPHLLPGKTQFCYLVLSHWHVSRVAAGAIKQ